MATPAPEQPPPGQEAKKLHFVIVGGSLGGLAAGIALTALGHDATILERNAAPVLQDQGAGIVAGGDTLAFFARYDRTGRPLAVRSARRQYLDRRGAVVHAVDVAQSMTSWDLAYHLLRANFDGLASAYCPAPPAPAPPGRGRATHLHDRRVTRFEEEAGGGVRAFWRTAAGAEGSTLGDVLVGADGPSSTVRALLEPAVARTYAGYCALRGTLPEAAASAATRAALCERFTFFHGPGVQCLAYLIPGRAGAVEPGRRLINFVCYANFPAGSPELARVLTGRDGRRRQVTMPPGMTDPGAWEEQRAWARAALPPPLAEVVCGAERPFVQAVTDVLSPRNEYLGGKVVLLGDALAGFRPHTVASTSQAAFDAMLYADYVAGRVSRDEWIRQTLGFARYIQRRGVDMGERSQHQDLPLEEYIRDRDVASTPREQEVFPDWATAI
ncbi:FAD/NAD(P)-binding domain-containing protein [Durotheca rogersii]|uniref:FAD/NAD(P)-binding domain-containing protein n=1 Tax=Durotheca rogersii TaxID=419775 RepID=UPI00221F9B71|nr:FAD/NAD(P)-binding domain-containing protein [Durotheca rogersii]KAI5863706.1 FAD/NAD(P)-binding domain-containing protein [Durotheca rogersii]